MLTHAHTNFLQRVYLILEQIHDYAKLNRPLLTYNYFWFMLNSFLLKLETPIRYMLNDVLSICSSNSSVALHNKFVIYGSIKFLSKRSNGENLCNKRFCKMRETHNSHLVYARLGNSTSKQHKCCMFSPDVL